MVFSSSIFLFAFLPLVIIGYNLFKGRSRIYFLFCASLFFYAWDRPKFVLVILLSIAINYSFGILIHYYNEKKYLSRVFLFISILGNLAILFYYKYLNFTISTVNSILGSDFSYHDILMPIGISFFTFQGMSYVIDLYWKKIKVQRNPFFIAFYISFFPQLMAGPIIRYITIEDQLYTRINSFEGFSEGAKRFIIGLAKKLIIANTVGHVADQIFTGPAIENTVTIAWLGIICYTFQIYFDFSGYSDMAIGLGKMFGFNFPENFNYPYISTTLTDFWRRWHISLSSWFRDYLYIPLGGNRKGNTYINLLIVFFVTGLWHGASFNFIVWGLWHGAFLIIERAFGLREIKTRILFPIRYIGTMLIVVVGWVFFRADSLQEALNYIGVMFSVVEPSNVGFTIGYYLTTRVIIILAIAIVASTPVIKTKVFIRLQKRESWKFISALLVLILLAICVVFVVSSSYNPFIYFRF